MASHGERSYEYFADMSQSNASGGGSRATSGTWNRADQVDEAYRRLGTRLSQRAWGDGPHKKPVRLANLDFISTSCFDSWQKDGQDTYSANESNQPNMRNPYKPARTIRGDNHRKKDSILKTLMCSAKDVFAPREGGESPTKGRKRFSPSSTEESSGQRQPQVSPSRQGLAQLSLDNSRGSDQNVENLLQRHRRKSQPKGLLSAVLEGNSSQSTENGSNRSLRTRESATGSYGSSFGGTTLSSTSMRPRGKCLTHPSEPKNNDGLDNADGNLIVFENDVIGISRRHIHTITNEKVGSMEFRILSLLGQGTFAQVFQCQHLQTSKLVAIKIVKNKSAYTRQAAVEIDVFRALVDKGQKTPGQSPGYENMVNMLCYFMYRSHLCLVFELLGLNLYEVLKRRQFRGMPLPVVRSIVRQAIEGVKLLGQKSIVHCDLKPENILLENDEDSASAVSSGERRAKTPRTKTTAHKEPPEQQLLDMSSEESSRSSRRSSNNSGSSGSSSSTSQLSASGTALLRREASVSSGSDPAINSQQVGQQWEKSSGSTGLTSRPATAVTSTASAPSPQPFPNHKIKLIDFGSACFEGHTAHTYIQSRFYRSPEILVGLPYDSSIDMWSLGCVAAELFLGLPILPGVHEHDQLIRICEMISPMPDWMLDQGSQSTKYFTKFVPRSSEFQTTTPPPRSHSPKNHQNNSGSPAPPRPQWRLKTLQEYIKSLTPNEVRKKGGMAKLEKPPGNRYFRRTKLADIVMLHGQSCSKDEKELLGLFVHFLYGILDPDPWKRWTAYQAAQHPFITGGPVRRKHSSDPGDLKEENQANREFDIYWVPPWDPSICRRKLLHVQKSREKQHTSRKNLSQSRSHGISSFDGSMSDVTSERYRRNGDPGSSPTVSGTLSSYTGSPLNLPISVAPPSGRSSPPSVVGSSVSSSIHAAESTSGRGHSRAYGSFGSSQGLVPAYNGPGFSQQDFPTASSYNDYYVPGIDERFGPALESRGLADVENYSVASGAQSMSNFVYDGRLRPPADADLSYALQRPGVVPGMGACDGSSVGSFSQGSGQHFMGMGYSPSQHLPQFQSQQGVYSHPDQVIYMSQAGGLPPHSHGSSQSMYNNYGGQGPSSNQGSYGGQPPLHQIGTPSLLARQLESASQQGGMPIPGVDSSGMYGEFQQHGAMGYGGTGQPYGVEQQASYMNPGGYHAQANMRGDGGYYYVAANGGGVPSQYHSQQPNNNQGYPMGGNGGMPPGSGGMMYPPNQHQYGMSSTMHGHLGPAIQGENGNGNQYPYNNRNPASRQMNRNTRGGMSM